MSFLNSTVVKIFTAIGFTIGALYLRIVRLSGRELWGDEIYQISFTLEPFMNVLRINSYGDLSAFPGDYLLTFFFVNLFHPNKWGMAIPHMIVTTLGFYYLYLLCKEYYKTVFGYIVAFAIVCFNQYLIFHAFELRPYAVLPTLALASFYYWGLLFRDYNKLGFIKIIAIGCFFILSIWYHAFGIIIIFFPFFYFLLLYYKTIKVKKLIKFFFIIYIIALPLWFHYAGGNPLDKSGDELIPPGESVFSAIDSPLDDFSKFFNYVVFYYQIGFKPLYFLIGAIILMIFVPYKEKMKKLGMFLCVVFCPSN